MEKKICIIACETVQDELLKVKNEINCSYPILWISSGLHNTPDKLRSTIQETVKKAESCDKILFAMGYCGNSIAGVETETAELIIPRVDDCISLLLGSVEHRRKICEGCGTYFLTKGWLKGERNLWAEYQYTVKKFGGKRAKKIMAVMLHNYKSLGVLDTGAYDIEEILPRTKEIAAELELNHEILTGSDRYIRRLLMGPWDDEQFLIVKPGSRIEAEALRKFY